MKRIRYLLRQGFTAVAIMMLVGVAPTPVFADTPTPTTDSSASPQTVPPPNNGPTGSDAHMYHYNAASGLWENDYYTYDPATQARSPKTPLEYTCNPSTGKWDATMWDYVASDDAYEQANIHLDTPPAGAITHDCPVVNPAPAAPTATDGASQLAPNTTSTDAPANSINSDNNSGSNQNNSNGITLNTNVNSNSNSGNALVVNNDDVGGAASGNANATSNVFNLLQSQAAFAGTGVNTFTANIQGNVQGDFVIDPASLAQPASISQSDLNKAKINNVTNGNINNNIVVNATSGNAAAENNDDVGAVSSGNATAIADVINMINSVVAANQSFVGTINIYGDYTGNILMPVDSLNALLASAGSTSNAQSNTNSSVDTASNYNIANNVNLGANTGTATASNNDDVGSVKTGNAMTNLTILNLTGKQVVAANSLLVFVNVLGNWVGLIMDAPAGTTSAALGGGVTNNAQLANSSDVTNTENYGIANNITANATSGNASATNNDDVGSVASGNALASVSLANLINSNFSVSNWFGVLFINVFGTWHGNFGVMKPPVVPPITSGSAVPGATAAEIFKNAKVFSFVPGAAATGSASSNNSLKLAPVNLTDADTTSGGSSSLFAKATAVLGASSDSLKPHTDLQQTASAGFNYWTVALLTIGSAGIAFVAYERIRSSLRSRQY
jgi:hypothetical protein